MVELEKVVVAPIVDEGGDGFEDDLLLKKNHEGHFDEPVGVVLIEVHEEDVADPVGDHKFDLLGLDGFESGDDEA